MRVHLGGERKRNDGLNHGILMIMEIGLKSETHATVKEGVWENSSLFIMLEICAECSKGRSCSY